MWILVFWDVTNCLRTEVEGDAFLCPLKHQKTLTQQCSNTNMKNRNFTIKTQNKSMGDSNMSQSQKHSQIPKPKKMYVNFCSYHTERGFFCHFCNAVLVLQNSPVLPRMPMNTIYIYINKSVQYFKYLHRTLTSRLKTSQYHFI